MHRSSLFLLLFVLYCVEIGVILVLWPWTSSWDRLWVQLPWHQLRQLGLDPLFRGVISGFGALHLVWGAHDLDLWLTRRRRHHRPES
jgi:hypothetical protein